MSEVRGDDALGGVPFNVSNPAFASGAGSTLAVPASEPEEVLDLPEAETEELQGEELQGEEEPPESDDDGIGSLSAIVPDPDADGVVDGEDQAGDLADDDADQAGDETTTDVPDGEV